MPTVLSRLEEIASAAEKHGPELRTVRLIQVGEWVRQGDLMIRRINQRPQGCRKLQTLNLVPGDLSQGARHAVEGPGILYALPKPTALQGPVLVAQGRVQITHPEHAHVSLPAGCYEVLYQRDFAAEELARVRD